MHYSLVAVYCAGGAYAEAEQWFQKSIHVFQEMEARVDPRTFALWSYAAHRLARLSESRTHLCQALHIASASERYFDRLWPLTTAAYILAQSGQPERAIELYALASRHPFVSNSRWFEDVFGHPIGQIATAMSPNVAAMAQQRGQADDLEMMVKEMIAEFQEN